MLTKYLNLFQPCKFINLRQTFHLLPSQRRLLSSAKIDSKSFFHRFIPQDEYVERQKRLVYMVSEYLKNDKNCSSQNGFIIVISGAHRIYVADTRIPSIHFKQNSDFLYFTGLNVKEAAHCCLVLLGNHDQFDSHLFFPFFEKTHFIWEGAGLKGSYYANQIKSISNAQENIFKLSDFLIKNRDRNIFISRAGINLKPPSISGHATTEIVPENPFKDIKTTNLSPFIDKMRLCKSPSEINCMRRSCVIGAQAMNSSIKWAQSQVSINKDRFGIDGVIESQIAAKFEFESRINGANKPSYPPVVAGDDRATIVHYCTIDKPVFPDQWILMDAGCEDIEGYASDITRSWPIIGTGKNSKYRLTKEIHHALQETQKDLIKFVENNMQSISLNDLFIAMCQGLSEVLIHFKLASKDREAVQLADHFCPHHVSHYLGLDVHDTPTINRDEKLANGMCFTIEPGLYFHHDDPKVPKDFQGIGIRVEDNFIITHDGVIENLTLGCPHLQY